MRIKQSSFTWNAPEIIDELVSIQTNPNIQQHEQWYGEAWYSRGLVDQMLQNSTK